MNTDLTALAKEKNGEAATPVEGQTAFKINKALHEKIGAYLNKRPFAEVDTMLTEVFEADYETTYITEDGMQQIVNYLMKCPRHEVKPLMAEISKPDSLVKFTVAAKKEAEAAPGTEEGAESKQSENNNANSEVVS